MLRGVWLVQKSGSWVQGWLPLSPLLPFFFPCLQRGLLNPPMWAVKVLILLPSHLTALTSSCQHPPTSPESRSTYPDSPFPDAEKDQASKGWVAHPALSIQSHKHQYPCPNFPYRAAGASRQGDEGLGLLTIKWLLIAISSYLGMCGECRTTMNWVHVIEGLQKVQGTVWLWVVRLRLKTVSMGIAKHGRF